jgi:hypothetical protein
MPINSAALEHDIFVTACRVEYSGNHIEVSREKFDPLRSSREHAIDHVISIRVMRNPPAPAWPWKLGEMPSEKTVASSRLDYKSSVTAQKRRQGLSLC